MGNAKEIFARRLKELREGQGKGVRELGIELGMSHSAISLYESMKRTPDIEVCKKIAEYFNVSGDYLLGISDSKGGGNCGKGKKS